jgi:hypothetical protein
VQRAAEILPRIPLVKKNACEREASDETVEARGKTVPELQRNPTFKEPTAISRTASDFRAI